MTKHIWLPGLAGNAVSTPDTPAVSVTGDIDLRCELALDAWISVSTEVVIAKEANADMSWRWQITTLGAAQLVFSDDGTTLRYA